MDIYNYSSSSSLIASTENIQPIELGVELGVGLGVGIALLLTVILIIIFRIKISRNRPATEISFRNSTEGKDWEINYDDIVFGKEIGQ